MTFIQTLYGAVGLAVGVYTIVFCLRVAEKRNLKAAAIYLAVFSVMSVFALFIVPFMVDFAVANTINRMESGYTGQVMNATASNGITVLNSGISAVNNALAIPPASAPASPASPSNPILPDIQQVRVDFPNPASSGIPALPRVESIAPLVPAASAASQPQSSVPVAPTLAAPVQSAPTHMAIDPTTPGEDEGLKRSLWELQQKTGSGVIIAQPRGNHTPVDPFAGSGSPDGGPSASAATIITDAVSGYTVQHGDSLFKIAQRHYGDGNRWWDICLANSVADCSNLRVGMVLELP